MKTSLSRRTLILLPLVSAALYGCPHDAAEDLGPEYADVIYVGKATDEAFVTLVSALEQNAPGDDPARAPHLESPVGTMLPATPIPTFTWHFGAPTTLAPTRFFERSPSLLPARPDTFERSWFANLGELVGPPRAAHAHGDPLTGPASFIVFSTAADPKVVRVFTDALSYQPAQAEWNKLVATKAEITLSLVGAEFDNNRIASGGAPVQGTKFVFTITP